MNNAASARTREVCAAAELFTSWNIAVFPGPYGGKGARTARWPEIDVRTAREITLSEAGKHDINLAARTGSELGVIDIDGMFEVDTRLALQRLLEILPEGVPVIRTHRGYGILFKPKATVGNGPLVAYGAELFSAGHLINIPPSRHPAGVDYEWLVPPGGELPTVDLEALGLLPEAAPALAASTPRSRRRMFPASAADQTEFQRLMAAIGLVPRRAGQELHHCPWHDDQTASLSINWDSAIFNDFAGCGQGGLADLRRLVAEPSLHRSAGVRSIAEAEVTPRRIDAERERARLVRAMKESGFAWPFDRSTARAVWEDVLECHVALVKRECTNGHRVAYPKSCGFGLCPICVPTRLKADFRRHSDHLPEHVGLFIVQPPDGLKSRTEISAWFKTWRQKMVFVGGFYGVRLRVGVPDILLVLPADQVPASLVSDPQVTLVSAETTLADAVAWYTEMFLEEVTSWRTPDEMLALLATVKGRRRFQGFGKYYTKTADATPEDAAAEEAQLFTGEPKKLHRISGGSAKGGSRAAPCPFCGARTRVVGIALNAEGMSWDSKRGCYIWGTGPPALMKAS